LHGVQLWSLAVEHLGLWKVADVSHEESSLKKEEVAKAGEQALVSFWNGSWDENWIICDMYTDAFGVRKWRMII
jgi:hypothetical protein